MTSKWRDRRIRRLFNLSSDHSPFTWNLRLDRAEIFSYCRTRFVRGPRETLSENALSPVKQLSLHRAGRNHYNSRVRNMVMNAVVV